MNDIQLTMASRLHFSDIQDGKIKEACEGTVKVNNLEQYILDCLESKKNYLLGKYDNTLTFKQVKHWIKTGESIPLLGK